MKKILLIDDNTDRWIKTKEYFPVINLTRHIEEYFEYDFAGNVCELKFNPDDYDFIFIHHSQQGDSIIPSNFVDQIKGLLGLKLIFFSGSIEQKFENRETEGFIFRSLLRDNLSTKIIKFINQSQLLGYWELEILYYDFEKRLLGLIMEMVDRDFTTEEILKNKVFKNLMLIRRIAKDSSIYTKLENCNPYELLEKLKEL